MAIDRERITESDAMFLAEAAWHNECYGIDDPSDELEDLREEFDL